MRFQGFSGNSFGDSPLALKENLDYTSLHQDYIFMHFASLGLFMSAWSPTSWHSYTYLQAARYPDERHFKEIVHQLSMLPPLVTSGEIKQLKKDIARAGRGEAFILQGGDCAESFAGCRSDIISNKLKIILQMSLILLHGLHKPIIRIGRIAGQYAKPRSSEWETVNGVTLPSYRGDIINAVEFTQEARTPNPDRLLKAHYHSALTLNFIRALLDGGFADLHHVHQWDLRFVEHSPQKEEYQHIVRSIEDSLAFLYSVEDTPMHHFNNAAFYTSHEALHLHYEQALTRQLKDGLWYNLSTHLPWVGMRTAQADGAHLELLRGIQNPIGIKIGPQTSPELLIEILERANPQREPGRILLLTRLGANAIEDSLPPLITAVRHAQFPVTWSCDPMHGNTETTSHGTKTRHFDTILKELKLALQIHQEMDSYLGGVHLELTGDNVTECLGGVRGLVADDLKTAYHSLVDPRLNYEQSLEIAFQLSRHFKNLSLCELSA